MNEISPDALERLKPLREGAATRRSMLVAGVVGLAGAMTLAGGASPAAAVVTDALLDKGGAVYNVKAYGAVGDNTTNDTTAINAALSAAVAGGGGIVYFPAGTYVLQSTLTVTTRGIYFQGAGPGASKIRAGAVSGDVIAFNLGTSGANQGGGVSDLSIISSVPRTGGAAIHLTTSSQMIVQNVDMNYMFNCVVIDGDGVLHWVDRGYWNNVSAGGAAIWINSGGNDHFISNIVADAPNANQAKYGLRVTRTAGLWVNSCDFIHSENGLLIDTPSGQRVCFLFITNTAFDSNKSRGMLLDPASGSTVFSLHFEGCWWASSQTYDGAHIGPNVDGVQFINGRFVNNTGNGLLVNGAKNVFVDVCMSTGNSGNGAASGGNGYVFTGNADRFALRSSKAGSLSVFGASQAHGVVVTAGCNNYIIANNVLQGNVAAISDSGGPIKSVTGNI